MCFWSCSLRLLCKGAPRTHLLRGKLLFFGYYRGAENALCVRCYHKGGWGQQGALPSLGKPSHVRHTEWEAALGAASQPGSTRDSWAGPWRALQGRSSHHAWLTTLCWAADREFLNFYYCSRLLLEEKEPILILETSTPWTSYVLSVIIIRVFFLLSTTEGWDFQEPVNCTGPSLLFLTGQWPQSWEKSWPSRPPPKCLAVQHFQHNSWVSKVTATSIMRFQHGAATLCPSPVSDGLSVCAHSVKPRCG